MPKECAVCKRPADMAAQINQGGRIVKAFLCNECFKQISKQYKIEAVDPFIDDKDTTSKKHNMWKIAFFGLLTIFIFVVIISLGTINILLRARSDISQPNPKQLQTQNNTNKVPSVSSNQDTLKEAKVGETVKTENWEITLNSIEFINDKEQIDNYKFLEAYTVEEEMCILRIHFTLKFTGKTRVYFNNLHVDADYDDGYIYALNHFNNSFVFQPKQSPMECSTLGLIPVEIEDNLDIPLRIVFHSYEGSDGSRISFKSYDDSLHSVFDGETIVFRVR